jgi:hypothetical protein
MVEPFIESSALSASTRALSNVLDDVYTYLKTQASIKIKKTDIQRKLPSLSNYIDSVRLVKTLWQIDKPVDVESFYCDSHVLLQRRGKTPRRKKIHFVSDLDPKGNFVIQGIAGQGKSILLRHLFINQTALGTHIPIFIELRRIQKSETLSTHISRFLQMLDLPSDPTIIRILLRSGKFMFFLDGFDEIADDQVMSILDELEYLTSVSRNCQFIVASRLHSPITMSPLFNLVSLDDLQGNEYQKLVRKLSDNKKYANSIINQIKAREPGISELLCTPLLVTLLLIAYKSYQAIPVHLSEFYESIFINLLQRHDGTKPAFTRSRRCSLNDNQYRQVFDAFCFQAKKQDTKLLSHQQIYSCVEQAMNLLDINEDVDSYIKDIKGITCLLLEESGQYRFIHNTVQEYYTASFIRSLPEPSAIRFYQACKDQRRSTNWAEELDFLRDIDRYRYTKYCFLFQCSKAMGYHNELDPAFRHPAQISLDRTRNILGKWELELGYDHDGKALIRSVYYGHTLAFWGRWAGDTSHQLFSLDFNELMANIASGKIAIHTRKHPLSPKDKLITITVNQILDAGSLTSQFKSIAQKLSLAAYAQWQEAIAYLHKKDLVIETLGII